MNRYDKVRNYVIGHQELGLPLDEIHKRFIESKLMDERSWNYLLEDPIAHTATPCGTCGGPQPPDGATLDEIFAWTQTHPHNMGCHMPRFSELASKCQHVTAMVKQKEFAVTLLAGRPKVLRVYTSEPSPIHERLAAVANGTDYGWKNVDWLTLDDVEETDLLVIHSIHQADRLYAELSKFAPRVRRWILLRSTGLYAENGEGGGPVLLPAMRTFMRENPEWSVIEHNMVDCGYTILGRDPADKPKLPSLPRMAWNYAKAIAKHQATGAKLASEAKIEARLNVCMTCPQRTDNRCSVCGCFLDVGPNERDGKAVWDESECPLGNWAGVDRQLTDDLGAVA